MTDIPPEAAAEAFHAVAGVIHQRHCRHSAGQCSGATNSESSLATAVIEAAAPHLAAAERERIAAQMDAYAGNYPEDTFPPDGISRDAIGGTAMRHAYRNAARLIRQEAP